MLLPKFDSKAIRNSAVMQSYRKIVDSNLFVSIFVKGISLIIVWACALIPFWMFLFVRWMIGPDDFWQEFAVFCVAAIVIGWAQVIMAIVGFVFSMIILIEDV